MVRYISRAVMCGCCMCGTKSHTSQSFKNCAQRHLLTNSQIYYSFLQKGWIKCLLLCTQNHWHL